MNLGVSTLAASDGPMQGGLPAQGTEPPIPRYLNREENIERLGQAMRISVRRALSSIQIRLSPPELGKVTLKVSVKEGVVSAKVQTDNPQAHSLLVESLSELRQNLALQNMRLGTFDVTYDSDETMSQFSQDMSQNTSQHHHREEKDRPIHWNEPVSLWGEIGAIIPSRVNMVA
ncbi:MAG: flagellar hook-length control protein FliK [Planctomycetota bacterium]